MDPSKCTDIDISKPKHHSYKGPTRRKRSIGRRNDGKKVKHGNYDYTCVRELHDLPHSAPPQQVSSAVMTDQLERQLIPRAPLKKELQRDLKKAQATILKHSNTIKRLKFQTKEKRVRVMKKLEQSNMKKDSRIEYY